MALKHKVKRKKTYTLFVDKNRHSLLKHFVDESIGVLKAEIFQ